MKETQVIFYKMHACRIVPLGMEILEVQAEKPKYFMNLKDREIWIPISAELFERATNGYIDFIEIRTLQNNLIDKKGE